MTVASAQREDDAMRTRVTAPAVSDGERAAWVAGLLLAAPVLIAYAPPMTDFPAHEAAVSALRHLRDPSRFPPGLYVLNLGHPNQLFHLLAWGLSFVLGVHFACKAVVAASLVAILVATARLARHAGTTPWAALLATPLAFGWTFNWGFVANLLGLAVLLASVPSLDHLAERPSARGALACTAWTIALYFAHEALLFVAIGFLVLLVAVRGGLRAAAWALVPIVIGLALVVGQAHAQAPLFGAESLSIPTAFVPLREKLERFPVVLLGRADSYATYALYALVYAACSAVYGRHRARRDPATTPRAWLDRHRFALLGLACLALYFAMPADFHAARYVYQRYLAPGAILLLVALAPPDEGLRIPAKLPFLLVPPLYVIGALPQFALASEISRELDPLLAQIPEGSAVANLDLDSEFSACFFRPSFLAMRVVAERGGRALVSFFDSPISPVLLARPFAWPDAMTRNTQRVAYFRPASDLRQYAYVLFFTVDAKVELAAPHLFEPEAELVAESGSWQLYRSRIVETGAAAPELPPLPATAAEPLGARLRRWGFPGAPIDYDPSRPPPRRE
jgi:hypothetical protein